MKIIGREKEQNIISEMYSSSQSEFLALYGRRRVGKTYLVTEFFSNTFSFWHSGLSNDGLKHSTLLARQLDNFYNSLKRYFPNDRFKKPSSWIESFSILRSCLEKLNQNKRIVVFIDELPWLDTPRSGFVQAFENFWNSWGCAQDNLFLIVCGSATSWMMDKLIQSRGGLYHRVTRAIKLAPLKLSDCRNLLLDKHVEFSNYDIAQLYMTIGGIPGYYRYISPTQSAANIIDQLFFNKNAIFKDEFDRLFNSIFTNPEIFKSIVVEITKVRMGLTREQILEKCSLSDGGSFAEYLRALEANDFIKKYKNIIDKKVRYKAIDPFCIFYVNFLLDKNITDESYWTNNLNTPKLLSWIGLAFERLCFNHVEEIKKKIGINKMSVEESSCCIKEKDSGAQIDMILKRPDNICHLCEIKFVNNDYALDKNSNENLNKKYSLLKAHLNKKTTIRNILITTFGLKNNNYSSNYNMTIVLDDLFDTVSD